MKKIGMILFVAAFLLMALIPFVGLLIFGPAEAAANEILAQPPSVTEEDGSFNTKVLNDASDYLADRFYLRQELITLDAKLESGVLGESAAGDVILGKEGWLYYATTLNDYRGQELMTDREIWAAAHTLELMREYAAGNGTRMLFVVVPNKNEVYPEYMPDWALRSGETGNRERLDAALEAAGVEYLDLLPVLEAEKPTAQLYQCWDSHWNNLGAALAHDAIVQRLGKTDTAYDPAAFSRRRDHAADLYAMLYPAGTGLDVQLYPDREWDFEYKRPIRSPEDQRINTAGSRGEGSLLMFRDSFGNTLHTFMAESYADALFSRAMPYDLTMLKPGTDDLVLELVQRNLPWLAQRAPIMPAPVRDPDEILAGVAEPIAVQQADAQNGMWRFTGAVPEADVNSPVYLMADGVFYEASPVGEEPGGFTAYLPGPAADVSVIYLQEGHYMVSPCGE